ncbi:MAG: hypothetical protein KBD63_01775, partial [Bacteriovoracaceae bacterium]|nr:hypothetical protein [Bacteriovoracaceae bacterium]
MYWQKFSWASPLITFKLPFHKWDESMGEAPKRAELFWNLAVNARSKNHAYCSYRFLGYALHYVQDVTNPFHAIQIPNFSYLTLPFRDKKHGTGSADYVAQLTQIISYYHLALEDHLAYLLKEFPQVLQNIPLTLNNTHSDIKTTTIFLAQESAKEAPALSRFLATYFTALSPRSFADWDSKSMMDELWQREQKNRPTMEKEEFLNRVVPLLKPLGLLLPTLLVEDFLATPVQKNKSTQK